jgi:hypothetical protein
MHSSSHCKGEAVLLIHGMPNNGRLWDDVVRELTPHYRCIVIDLPGMGETPFLNRRNFLRANGSICAGFAFSRAVPVLAHTLSPSERRTFEVVTKVELLNPSGISHIWLPAALMRDTPYQRTLRTRRGPPAVTPN